MTTPHGQRVEHGPQRRLAAPQRDLGAVAVRDVARDPDHPDDRARALAHRYLHGRVDARAAVSLDDLLARPGPPVVQDLAVGLRQPGRHRRRSQLGVGASDHVVDGAAERLRGRRVRQHVASAVVLHEDRVRRGVDDPLEQEPVRVALLLRCAAGG
jgi:hypothetical protein